MIFNHLPPSLEEFEKTGSDLENTIEFEVEIIETWPEIFPEHEELPGHYNIKDDYLQKEIERREQENLNKLLQPKLP